MSTEGAAGAMVEASGTEAAVEWRVVSWSQSGDRLGTGVLILISMVPDCQSITGLYL